MGKMLVVLGILLSSIAASAADGGLRVGIATRDITPTESVWLNGYAARKKPSDKVAQPLLARAAAFEDSAGERFVLLAIDNCEANKAFAEPVLAEIQQQFGLAPEAVVIVWSHTHSAPCLANILSDMFHLGEAEAKAVQAYTDRLRPALVDAVGDALKDLQPARLETGCSVARFAMNRRVFREDRVEFGQNPEGPVDHQVPVLAIRTPQGDLRAVLFGYACHGTTNSGGDDWYTVSGEYMAFARQEIEAAFPGTKAVYLTGAGADSNPAPRGSLALARQHGLELAGAVAGVLSRPMTPVRGGPIRRAYARLALPLAPGPTREKLVEDSNAKNVHVQSRARLWLKMLDSGKPVPAAVECPIAVYRIGDDLTFFCLAGEPVVDYSLRIKREFAAERPWVIGYAFEVPCYIPSARIIKEGGYEPVDSLIYYGIYGPFQGVAEQAILDGFRSLVETVRKPAAKPADPPDR